MMSPRTKLIIFVIFFIVAVFYLINDTEDSCAPEKKQVTFDSSKNTEKIIKNSNYVDGLIDKIQAKQQQALAMAS